VRVDIRLAELSRTVDVAVLGQRLRSARVAAGLTQAELAGDEVTAAYISRIEAGQRRPEAKLLERMAARLDVELSSLVDAPVNQRADELRVRLDHAELSLVSGDAQTALDSVDEVLAEESFADAEVVRRGRQVRALALEALGRSGEAIRLLEDLVTHPTPDVGWVKAVIALSRCYRESGDFARAIEVGERAGGMIDELGLAGTTEAIQLTVTIAGAYLERGDLAHALQMCERCIEDAERVHSPVAKASAYWNASVIESLRGNAGAALELAQKAIALFELGEDSRNLGRLRTEVAFMQMLQTPPDPGAAKRTLELAERELTWSSASQVDRARHRLMAGKADFLLGDNESAEGHAESARELVGDESPMLLAETQALAGQIQAARGDLDSARASYSDAIASLSGVGIDRDVARLWFDLARLLEQAGDSSGALDAYRRGATATGLVDPRTMLTDADNHST
jgi:tetratricopeptide (TPR) repeat protein